MKIVIQHPNLVLSDDERARVKEQAELLFSRIRKFIDSIHITLSDQNGPKGGIDKACTVVVHGKLPEPLVIKDTRGSHIHAVRSALQRANHTFLRRWKRKHLVNKPSNTRATTMDDNGDTDEDG